MNAKREEQLRVAMEDHLNGMLDLLSWEYFDGSDLEEDYGMTDEEFEYMCNQYRAEITLV